MTTVVVISLHKIKYLLKYGINSIDIIYVKHFSLLKLDMLEHFSCFPALKGYPVGFPYITNRIILMRYRRRQIKCIPRLYIILMTIKYNVTLTTSAVYYLMIRIAIFSYKMKFSISCTDSKHIQRQARFIAEDRGIIVSHNKSRFPN